MEFNKELRKELEENHFFSKMGFEIINFQDDSILIKLPVKDQFLNLSGTLHGGIHATMIDWVVGMLVRLKTKGRCATISLNLNYLAPSTGGTIYATGRIIQEGYRLVTTEAEITDNNGTLLAKGVGTFKVSRD